MTERRSGSNKMKNFEISTSIDEIDFVPRDRVPLLPRYPPPKTTIAAALLLVGGCIFIAIGLSILLSSLLSHGKDRGIALLVLGGISKLLLDNSYWCCFLILFIYFFTLFSVYSRHLCVYHYIRIMAGMGWLRLHSASIV
jgi:hypothetical protein